MDRKSQQPPVPPIPFRRRLWVLGPLVTGAVALAVAGAVTTDDGRAIVEFAPWIAATLAIVAVGWFIGLAVLGGMTGSRRGPGSAALLVTGCVALFGACVVGGFPGNTIRWRPVATVVDGPRAAASAADGTTWAAFLRGWMDPDFAVVRLTSRGHLTTRWDIVATVSPSLDGGVRVIRPAGLEPSHRVLVRNGFVALISQSGTCDVATTMDGRVVVGVGDSGGPHESPGPALPDGTPVAFLLVEPGDVLLPTDVENLSASIEHAASDASAWVPDLPTDEGLVVALDSPHPGIGEAAVRFVRAGGERLYPRAMARLRR